MLTITKSAIQANPNDYRFLETDGNGGFISHTVTGNNVRNDDSLYTISLKAPIKRYKLVQKFDEQASVATKEFKLSSQSYVNNQNDVCSKHHILKFESKLNPEITYQLADVRITKSIAFSNVTSQVAVKYQIENPFNREVKLLITPQLAGHNLGEYKPEHLYDYQPVCDQQVVSYHSPTANPVYIKSNAQFTSAKQQVITDYYYPHDSRDGRNAIGSSASYGNFEYKTTASSDSVEFVISATSEFNYSATKLIDQAVARKFAVVEQSTTHSKFGQDLALATDNYLVNRESTGEKTIIAGYPFFGDWGRDTFWAFNGVCLQTKRYQEAKGILRSFIKYEKNGLIPNMFPEGDEYPFYNSVDAPLLFINSVYEYYQHTDDSEFVLEAMPTISKMINNYISGTDYHIYMDSDGLIASGANLEQLTWMDVRFDQILPTPRQGKCVEINGMWYNALKVVLYFEQLLNIEFDITNDLNALAAQVQASFREQFILENGYLKDVINNTSEEIQIRSNAIWVVTQNFSPLTTAEMKSVVAVASEHLYTSFGIRTLSPSDQQFKAKYGDSHFERDMAYHQGTVWPFILGGYVRAYLKSEEYSSNSKLNAKNMLEGSSLALSEYCVGQICEVLDGLNPSHSKGCYAQAWSVAEIYRALNEVEE